MSVMLGYRDFIQSVADGGESIILCAIFSDSWLHPCATDLSLLFIRDTKAQKTFTIAFDHPDLSSSIDKFTVLKDLSALPNRKWVFDKKSFMQKLPVSDLYDINLYKHLWEDVIYEMETFHTNAHRFVYRGKRGNKNLNRAIPALKHKEMFDWFCSKFIEETSLNANVDNGFRKENEIIIETLSQLESNGIYVNQECFNAHFDAPVQPTGLVYSQYNLYTSTGRPSNHFHNVNYAALNKENGVRNCFTSRYGEDGKIILIDYSAFHPRIITHLVNFPLAIDIDIYRYLGELYFKRKTDIDIDLSKQLTFRQLYGGVEEQFEHIKYFSKLKDFMNENWQHFQTNGFVLTPYFRRSITDRHLKDGNPSKVFNYILQATETEVAISAMQKVNQYLRGKRTKAVLYTYDSMMFDFHKEDGQTTLNGIMDIMKINNKFPIKVYAGASYETVTQIHP